MAVKLSNNATSTLSAALTASATSLTVQANDAPLFPSPQTGEWFPATLVNTTGAMEIVWVTGRNGATMTIRRGQEGTTAKDFPAGSKIDLRLTVGALLDLPKPKISDVVDLEKSLADKLDTKGGMLSGRLIIPDVDVDKRPIAEKVGDGVGESNLAVRGNGDGPAAMTFHRPGAYAIFFGLDTDNQLKVGGWSAGKISYTLWHAGNFKPDTKFDVSGGTIYGDTRIEGSLSLKYDFYARALSVSEELHAGGGSATFSKDGNIWGSVWSNWGNPNAYAAIENRIESRAIEWANNRVWSMQYRLVSVDVIRQGNTQAPSGACVTGMNINGTGNVAGYYIRYLQVFDPVRGWVGFYNA